MDKNKIGVFCGSFNPILNSHLSLAEGLINDGLEKVIFVPVSSKYQKEGLVSDEHRFNMLKIVCKNNSKFDVSDIEIKSQKWMRTFDTLNALKDIYPENEINLIIGTDNLKELYWWYEIEALLKNFKIIVLARDEDNIEEIINNDKLLSKYKKSFIKSNSYIRTNLSSTYVRNLIKNKKEIKYLLPDEVIEYIYKNNLYLN